jgi:hypothetical protein
LTEQSFNAAPVPVAGNLTPAGRIRIDHACGAATSESRRLTSGKSYTTELDDLSAARCTVGVVVSRSESAICATLRADENPE